MVAYHNQCGGSHFLINLRVCLWLETSVWHEALWDLAARIYSMRIYSMYSLHNARKQGKWDHVILQMLQELWSWSISLLASERAAGLKFVPSNLWKASRWTEACKVANGLIFDTRSASTLKCQIKNQTTNQQFHCKCYNQYLSSQICTDGIVCIFCVFCCHLNSFQQHCFICLCNSFILNTIDQPQVLVFQCNNSDFINTASKSLFSSRRNAGNPCSAFSTSSWRKTQACQD